MSWTQADKDGMDLRLKGWGRWCRAGACDPALWESDKAGGAGLTRDQVWDAWAVQLAVMRLPIDMRMVCQVHYVSRPVEVRNGEGESRVGEVNRRLRVAGIHRRMSADSYRSTRERAVANLLNGTRHLTAPAARVECAPNRLGLRTSVADESKGLAA